MIINHNISSINSNRLLSQRSDEISSDMTKLSSGMRINRSGDDAAGLAVSEKMRTQIRGLNKATENAQNGISFIQTTEGFLQQTQDIIGRIRELAVQSANGIYTSDDRAMVKVEVDQLIAEVDRISSHAEFNTLKMLTGNYAKSAESGKGTAMTFHIGANQNQSVAINIGTINSKSLKIASLSVSTTEGANTSMAVLDDALRTVSKQRADLGAYQNRMTSMVKSLQIASENIQASESVIRDTNMAQQMVDLTKNSILQQANMSMLGQANTRNQGVLRLLG